MSQRVARGRPMTGSAKSGANIRLVPESRCAHPGCLLPIPVLRIVPRRPMIGRPPRDHFDDPAQTNPGNCAAVRRAERRPRRRHRRRLVQHRRQAHDDQRRRHHDAGRQADEGQLYPPRLRLCGAGGRGRGRRDRQHPAARRISRIVAPGLGRRAHPGMAALRQPHQLSGARRTRRQAWL